MKALEDIRIFYESHLSEEILGKLKAKTRNEGNYMEMLIEEYNKTSNHTHEELNIRTKNKDIK